MERKSFDQQADEMASKYRTAQELADLPVYEERVSFNFGRDEGSGPDEDSLEAFGRKCLLSPPEKKRRDSLIRKAILNDGMTIEGVMHTFQVPRRTATQMFFRSHANATISDFGSWPDDVIRDFKRAALIKIAVEGAYSDDVKEKGLALKALQQLGDRIPPPLDTPENRPKDPWEDIIRKGGDLPLHQVLDKSEEG